MNSLRKWFGPSREEIWRTLSAEMKAHYVKGGFWKGDKVVASHGDWSITLDTYFCPASKMTYTRLRAPYSNPDGFRFKVYRKGFFSELGKMLGMQDVVVGHDAFDREFIIKGNSEGNLRELFDSARIRGLLEALPQVSFGVDDLRGDADELRFMTVGVIKDVDRLKLLFDLFAETLEQLGRMGAALPSRS